MLIIASTFSFSCKKDSASSDNGGGQPGETQHLPYFQSFETEFGTYSTKNVIGEQEWMIEYSSVQIKGYDGGSKFDNEDWLISSKVSVTGVEHAKMVIKYVARYFNGIGDCVTILASTNYNHGDMPSTAEWTRIPAKLVECNSWYDISTIELNLDDFIGQTVTFAVKFTSTTEKAGGLKIVSISIEESVDIHPGETQYLPYVQNFDAGFGTYTTQNVIGDQEWHIEYSTATMLGYDHANEYANEDWLISSPVSVTGVGHAKMTMNYVGCNFLGITNSVTIWASTDYIFGSTPSTATWTRVPAVLYESDSWYYYKTAEVDLDDYLGQTVTFAVKFISYERHAGGISIRSISIEEGEVYGGGATQNLPYVQSFETEFGTYIPKSVVGDQEWNIDYETAWMQGCVYHDGSYENYDNEDWLISSPVSLSGVQHAKIVMEYIGHYFNTYYPINENVTLWASTNYNYGDMPSTASWTQIPANLEQASNWTDFLTVELSLDDFIGQTVTIAVKYLSTTSYAGTIEIQSISVEEGVPTGQIIYSETFASGQGDFAIKDVIKPNGLSFVWEHSSIYNCMKATGHTGGTGGPDYETESWLISPSINLSGATSATLYFDQAVNYLAPDGFLFVMISTDYVSNVATATWHELNVDQWPAGTSWNYTNSTADLSQYVGRNVNIAFKYTSVETGTSTWEIKNFVVRN